MSRAGRGLFTAESMLRTEWWMSATGVVRRIPAQRQRASISKATRRGRMAGHMLRRAWWMSRAKRCSHDSCIRRAIFDVEGRKKAAYCKQHAGYGMVHLLKRRCKHDSCSPSPSYNEEETKTGTYCRQHAADGMLDVSSKRYTDKTCTRAPTFNVDGSKAAAYCKEHAANRMVDVRNKRCSHTSCLKRPGWGILTDGRATACIRQTRNLSGTPVVNFEAKCKVAGCRKQSRWGRVGKQPTYCLDHGPLQAGLVRTLGTNRIDGGYDGRPSYRAVKGPSVRVKAGRRF